MKYTPNLVTRCLLDLDCERKEKHIVFTESLWEVQSRDFDCQENLKILDAINASFRMLIHFGKETFISCLDNTQFLLS